MRDVWFFDAALSHTIRSPRDQDRDQIIQDIGGQFSTLVNNSTRKLRHAPSRATTTRLVDDEPRRVEAPSRLTAHQTVVRMDLSSQTTSSTSPSGDEALYIDPGLLRPDHDHNAVASPTMSSTIKTAGNSLGVTGAILNGATAGRR
jgi:hypothetical protein